MPKKGEYINLEGNKYNRLLVLEIAKKRNKKTYWRCLCDCGTETVVSSDHLKSGHTKSCGCLNREQIKMLNYKNGLTQTRLHQTYWNMINRCKKEGNEYYAERGISVCDEWKGEDGFVNFANWALSSGYKDDLQIDRIDNDKGYSPDNCRWADRIQQANNKRNNRYVKVNGEVGTVGDMARKHKIDYWNLLHYAKGGKNTMYPELKIEVANGL